MVSIAENGEIIDENTNFSENSSETNAGGGKTRVPEPDPPFIRIPGQNYLLISNVGPTAGQKNDFVAIKVRGCFSSIKEADEFAKDMREKVDPDFDYFIIPMWTWVLLPLNPEQVRMKYTDKHLDQIMEGYYESMEKSQLHLQERLDEARKYMKPISSQALPKFIPSTVNAETRAQEPSATLNEISQPFESVLKKRDNINNKRKLEEEEESTEVVHRKERREEGDKDDIWGGRNSEKEPIDIDIRNSGRHEYIELRRHGETEEQYQRRKQLLTTGEKVEIVELPLHYL